MLATTVTPSSFTWKRVADQNLQSAKLLARICVGLAVMLLATGAYAVSVHAQYSGMCTTLEHKTGDAAAVSTREFGISVLSKYCD